MILGIIALLLLVPWIIYKATDNDEWLGWWVVAGIAFFFSWVPFLLLYEESGNGTEDVSNDIVSLSTISKTSGSFFLGSGNIDDEAVYYYYVKNDDGSYHLSWQYAATSNIVQTDETPHIVFHCGNPSKSPDWAVWPLGFLYDDEADCQPGDHTTFYIPTGSIDQTFDPNIGE